MLCPYCNQKYDDQENKEVKLPDCGHSVCANCLSNSHNGEITCSTCGKKQKIEKSLPKSTSRSKIKKSSKVEKESGGNQVMMEVQASSQSEEEEDDEDDDEEEDSRADLHSMTSMNKSENICPLHFKPFDGFCLTCNCLICIDCIFEKHKSHDFHQLEKARDRAATDLSKIRMKVESLKDDCFHCLRTAKNSQKDLESGLEQRLIEVKTVMNELRRFIMAREQKLEENLKNEFEVCREAISSNIGLLEKESMKLSSVLSAIDYHVSQGDIRFLGKYRLP